MKKKSLFAMLSVSLLVFACKPKNGAGEANGKTDSTVKQDAPKETVAQADAPAGNTPKTYVISFTPDSALVGKQKEASIKISPVSATDLSDPDGKSEGIEMTFKITVTNKNKIGGNSVGVSPSDFRLVLDNNTSISQTSGGYVSAEPESTKESNEITYRLPTGSKPKTLNLFYDETRAAVGVSLK
jgi:hypothetical protein